MEEENKKNNSQDEKDPNDSNSEENEPMSLEDIKNQFRAELNRLKNIVNRSEEIDQPELDQGSEDAISENGSHELEIMEKLNEKLIWKASEVYYEILNRSENKKSLIELFDSLQETLMEDLREDYSEEDLGEDLVEYIDSLCSETKKKFTIPSKMREEAFKFAQNTFSSKQFYLDAVAPIPEEYLSTIRRELDSILEEGQNIFTLREQILSKVLNSVESEDLNHLIKEMPHIIREIFSNKQEYIDFIQEGWEISIKFAQILRPLLDLDENYRQIQDSIFDAMFERNRIIIREFAEHEAARIYQ